MVILAGAGNHLNALQYKENPAFHLLKIKATPFFSGTNASKGVLKTAPTEEYRSGAKT